MSETTTPTRTDRSTTRNMMWISGVVALLGLWIAISPFVLMGTVPPVDMIEMGTWNNLIIGIAILLIAGYNYNRLSNDRVSTLASAALVTVLGLWMIVAAFAFVQPLEAMIWSDVIAGAIVAILAGYHLYVGRQLTRAPAAGT